MVPITGKQSYARVREELKDSSSGVEPSRMDLFCAYFSKDGNTKTVEAAKEQMEEFRSQLPEDLVDNPGPEDVFSKVMGEDKNGTANMYGLGVRSCDVWGVTPSRSASRRENLQWKSKCEKLSDEVAHLNLVVSKMQGSGENTSNGSSGLFTSREPPVIANPSQRLRVGAEVYVKNILNSTENVAKGWIKSLDPKDLVGGEEIGPDWCEVNVQIPFKRNECLVRPYGFIVTVEDAVGASVAWPCSFISVVPMDDA